MKLREHSGLVGGWTEGLGGVGRAPVVPIDNRDVLVSVSLSLAVGSDTPLVTLTTTYQGNEHVRDIFVRDDRFGQALTNFLQTQVGKTVWEVGEVEVNF